MYNPHHLHECEKEKTRKPRNKRKWADGAMTFVGIVASLSSLPQVYKIWETKSAGDVSLTTYLVSLGSVLAWFFYGTYIKNKPLIYTTAVAIIILSMVVIQILIYG